MDRDVDGAVEERADDLGHEQALEALRRGVGARAPIAGGDDRHELSVVAGRAQPRGDLLRLGERES